MSEGENRSEHSIAATESSRATAERIVRDLDTYGDPRIYALAESYLRFINRPLPSQASVHDLNHEITRLHTVIDCLLPANGCVTVEEAIRVFGEKP